MKTTPVYRVCRTCGERWNVSCIYPGQKKYICPICTFRARKKVAA